ncbi:MAG: class I SAM-dependent methyltransferase [Candidatus Pacebacteria bacterium]|nr:class I SAM-dependent methyltransferase [Candidatus Paceibacterota bacterium]
MSPTGFLDPNEILNQLSLEKDMVAVDFGCGSGGWVIPLARKLDDGIVYAVDVQESALSAMMSKANLQGISNIKKVLADIEKGVKQIESSSINLVLMTNLLFQVDDKEAVFKEAKRILKESGKVLVIEWDLESPFGPMQENRISSGGVQEIAQKVGFVLEKEIETSGYHYGLLFNLLKK